MGANSKGRVSQLLSEQVPFVEGMSVLFHFDLTRGETMVRRRHFSMSASAVRTRTEMKLSNSIKEVDQAIQRMKLK